MTCGQDELRGELARTPMAHQGRTQASKATTECRDVGELSHGQHEAIEGLSHGTLHTGRGCVALSLDREGWRWSAWGFEPNGDLTPKGASIASGGDMVDSFLEAIRLGVEALRK